jgi:hypothetical protein
VFINVINTVAHTLFNKASVGLLERRETAYIKRLGQMRRMCGHAEDDDMVFQA